MVAKKEFFFPSCDGRTDLHGILWSPEGTPRAVLQLAHGICEYIGRYDAFASFLAEQGFLVVGNDHLGHGLSFQDAGREGLFAEKDGWRIVTDDMEALRAKTAAENPGVPYFLLGHSMGSFLARTYLIRYPGRVRAAVICGTGQQSPAVVKAGKLLTDMLRHTRGPLYRSDLVKQMAFGSYNKEFKPIRTENDWICSDPAVVDAYCADRGTQFLPTVSLYSDMLGGILFMSDPKELTKMDKATPIFFIAGEKDPVGEAGKGVERSYRSFLQAGCTDVKKKIYQGGRHEILNESFKQQVWQDVLDWLCGYIE